MPNTNQRFTDFLDYLNDIYTEFLFDLPELLYFYIALKKASPKLRNLVIY